MPSPEQLKQEREAPLPPLPSGFIFQQPHSDSDSVWWGVFNTNTEEYVADGVWGKSPAGALRQIQHRAERFKDLRCQSFIRKLKRMPQPKPLEPENSMHRPVPKGTAAAH